MSYAKINTIYYVDILPQHVICYDIFSVAEIHSENKDDDDIFSVFGEDPTLSKDFGEEIHSHLAVRWNNILQKGIKKENRSDLIKQYLPPSNCTFLLPPKLNDEIKAAVQETAVKRDSKLEQKQAQLGAGITCIGKAIDVALKIPDKQLREKIIKYMGDGGQILTDLHYLESLTRRSLLGQGLNKNTKDAIKDIPRDNFLFGEVLPDKLKAVKACSKSATDIKVKPQKASSSHQRPNSKASNNSYTAPATLNWRGSSHRPLNTMTAGAYRERRPAAPTSSAAPRRAQTSQRPQQAKRS
ncbi:uncharacterized protein LOC126368074 [Pectinophora gossypiella]|uniref:uncharacterized protein LOC126368074 n=1 Tax=Pectinophora gossypiella TaxID=13191 RepID=UPI00214E6D3F|nr:uncharacterized protein LOC126368074 [Pectinophora gossypiella]